MRLALDVMGGDHAPDAILKGAVQALELLDADDRLVLVGPQDVIREHLAELVPSGDERIEIHHAPDMIEMHEPPARAVRTKANASIVQTALLGSSRKSEADLYCDAVLSAGNTGAFVSAAIMHQKRLKGVHRPGIAVTIPAFHGPLVLCDAGANPEPKGAHLWQYGVMASVYAQEVHGIENPRVALMNIGAEEGKGSELVKQARDLLASTPGLNFIGYVEGRDVFDGVADVIVTDGFVGNTVLKVAEGLAKSLFAAIAQEIFESSPELAVKFEPVVKQIYAKNDYHETGGAPLLGVDGITVIAHGSSEARTIRAALRNCKKYVNAGLNGAIVRRMAEVAHVEHPTPSTPATPKIDSAAASSPTD
ncbi:MAG: phosphate acyltransferase PlsX [Planctomycetota bacterium]